MTGLSDQKHQYLQRDQLDGLVAAAGVGGASDIMDAFWRSTATLVDALETAITENDFDEASKLAHALKGSAGNVGAGAICSKTKILEACCKDENLGEAKDIIIELHKIVETTADVFAQYFDDCRSSQVA